MPMPPTGAYRRSFPGGPNAVKSGSSGVPPVRKLFKCVISPKSVFHDIMTPPGPKVQSNMLMLSRMSHMEWKGVDNASA